MFQFALIRDGYGLKTLVRMASDATFFAARRKLMWGGIIEQQKRTQFLSQAIVVEHGMDGESIADPNSPDERTFTIRLRLGSVGEGKSYSASLISPSHVGFQTP